MKRTPRDRMTPQERRAWYHNVRWIGGLLAVWFLATFGVSWFARELRFDFLGWPFSFWMAAQGSLILYVAIAALYAWRMNRADDEAHAAEQALAGAGAQPAAEPDRPAHPPGPGTI
ncbi:DUF4212 domain-containing protein [Cupriavidus sp. SZY C1]|uniref:DUF4212 domain-containing protein n=1 Tax=Cupriavidus sp. SZY C1 TaxID=3055037 RepID=UPI0028B7FDF6|nr:DUF4212 domain-containing protein [Cupriavidus sp. SZY C1]MDT6962602.1 DUF4212 domain-containing protein [Cupriavidus sp. SZY C1]